MRDPERIDPIIEELRRLWKQAPDLRLAQIIVNAAAPSEPAPQLFYIEDESLREGLRRLAAQLEIRIDGTVPPRDGEA